jgi:formamidopyrimidine-DNA glycosylase
VRCWSHAGEELRFVDVRRFARMWWVPNGVSCEHVITGLQKLGPEPFSAAFSTAHLHDRLEGSVRPIKAALLDQGVVAGVGNIYADESLFMAGLAPGRRSGSLSGPELERLRQSLIQVLEISIGSGGTTFSDFRDLTGTNGRYGGMAWVYRRTGEPCRRCGTPIARDRLAGRSTHWCPVCQV